MIHIGGRVRRWNNPNIQGTVHSMEFNAMERDFHYGVHWDGLCLCHGGCSALPTHTCDEHRLALREVSEDDAAAA
jgi:hypothetical protein